MFPMAGENFEKLIKLTGPIKVTESMHKSVKALAKKHNRNDQNQIRELIKLGLEKIKEEDEPTYRKSDLVKIVGLLIEEKMSKYSASAMDGPLKKQAPKAHDKHRQASPS